MTPVSVTMFAVSVAMNAATAVSSGALSRAGG
jgi:hypothetical protein